MDADTLIYYEGNFLTGAGLAVEIDVAGANAMCSFHVYCALSVFGAEVIRLPSELSDLTCPQLEEGTFGKACAQSRKSGHPSVMTEFGAVPDLDEVARVAAMADRHRGQ